MKTIEEVQSVHGNRFGSVVDLNPFSGKVETRKPYNWYHEHNLPDPSNGAEVLIHRINETVKRKAEAEDKFWNEVVVPNIKADVEEAKIEDFLLPAGEWDEVQPQNIADPSDIKIGFRK